MFRYQSINKSQETVDNTWPIPTKLVKILSSDATYIHFKSVSDFKQSWASCMNFYCPRAFYTTRTITQMPSNNSTQWQQHALLSTSFDVFCITWKKQYLHKVPNGWWHGSVVERRSLAGKLSMSHARPSAYVSKPSTGGQPTRSTQPFILSRSINE